MKWRRLFSSVSGNAAVDEQLDRSLERLDAAASELKTAAELIERERRQRDGRLD